MFIQEMKENFKQQQEKMADSVDWYEANKLEINRVAQRLNKIEINRVAIDGKCVDIYVAGDKHVLDAVFGAFRALGYEPSSRPGKKPESQFICYWHHPTNNVEFYLVFASNKCTRIKTGTKMVPQDTYETVCE